MTDGSARPPPGVAADVRARWLVAQVEAEAGEVGPEAALRRVGRAAAAALTMRGGVVHLATTDGVSGAVIGTDDASTRIADLSFTTGEGPSLDAFVLRRPILVNDLARPPLRWPGFTQAAVGSGVLAVFSLPLQIGAVTLGVLELYADRVRSLTEPELALAVAFAQLAARGLLGEDPALGDGDWEPLLDHRAEVHQAQGMVMIDLGVDLAEALLRMRAFSFAEGIALIDLAYAIIAGFALPLSDGEFG